MDEKEIKQRVSQLVFDIRKQVQSMAYWNAAQLSKELFELLYALPWVEADNPPLSPKPAQARNKQ